MLFFFPVKGAKDVNITGRIRNEYSVPHLPTFSEGPVLMDPFAVLHETYCSILRGHKSKVNDAGSSFIKHITHPRIVKQSLLQKTMY